MVEEDEALLLAYLNSARDHVVAALDGVSDADLRRAVVPSGWSMLGLVQHLALDVERFWFRAVMAGEDVALCTGSQAWQVDDEVSGATVIEAYRSECALADSVIRRTGLDAPAAAWRPEWGHAAGRKPAGRGHPRDQGDGDSCGPPRRGAGAHRRPPASRGDLRATPERC